MPARLFALLCLVAAAMTTPSYAAIGTIDNTPGATLLYPHFEVDTTTVNGVNTVLTLQNSSATAILVNVTLWTDYALPTAHFNVYLTGYDQETLDMGVILRRLVPRTASAGQDPTDLISPQGDFSQDINFASCTGQLPPPALPASFISHLQLSLTGKASPILGGLCAGRDLGDSIARGYVTVDTVNNCTLRFPGDAGYFAPGGTGDATNQNVLWGDFFYVNPGQNFAQGNALVHIAADADNPELSVPGQYTFYGRYVNWTAADNRYPLPTNFATRYITGGLFDGGTSLAVWRDSKVNHGAFTCPASPGVRPPWYPLGQEGIVIFDEQENPSVAQTFPFSPQPPTLGITPFPAEAQRTEVGGAGLPVPFDFGWLYLNLNTTVAAAGANPPEDPAAAQAWVVTVMDAEGRFSVGYDAAQLDTAAQATHFVPHP